MEYEQVRTCLIGRLGNFLGQNLSACFSQDQVVAPCYDFRRFQREMQP
jgi:hypothetical protein